MKPRRFASDTSFSMTSGWADTVDTVVTSARPGGWWLVAREKVIRTEQLGVATWCSSLDSRNYVSNSALSRGAGGADVPVSRATILSP